MPDRALIACVMPGCTERSEHRKCSAHRTTGKAKQQQMSATTVELARFYRTVEWKNIRRRQLRMHPFCQWVLSSGRECGRRTKQMHVDHKTTRRSGGGNEPGIDLQTLCSHHHSHKTAKFDGGFGNSKQEKTK